MIKFIKRQVRKFIVKHSNLESWRCYSKAFYEDLAIKRSVYLIENAIWSFVIWISLLSILGVASYIFLDLQLNKIDGGKSSFLIDKLELFNMELRYGSVFVVLHLTIFVVLYFQVFRTNISTKLPQKKIARSIECLKQSGAKPWYLKALKYWFILFECVVCIVLINEIQRSINDPRFGEYLLYSFVVSVTLVFGILIFNRLSLFNYILFSLVIMGVIFSLPLMILHQHPFQDYYRCLQSLLGVSSISMFGVWVLLVFFIVPEEILRKRKFKTDLQHKVVYFFTFWKYFFGSLALKDIATVSGTIWFFVFSMFSTIILSGFDKYNSFDFWGYIAAYFASIALAFAPLFNALVDLNSLFSSIFNRFITKSVLKRLNNHLVIVGLDDLGRSTIRSVFNKMHGGKKIIRGVNRRGFSIIVDENLDIGIVSHNIVAIDKDKRLFLICDSTPPDYSIGLFSPYEGLKIFIVAICGDIMHPAVAQISNLHLSSVLYHTLSDHQTTLSMSKQKLPAKKILATMDTPSYDAIVAQGYGNPVFAVNTTFIEGISIAQKIIQYFMKELSTDIQQHYYDPKALMQVRSVLLIGEGKIIYYIVHSIRLSLEAQIHDKMLIKKILESKLIVFSNDPWFNEEIVKNNVPGNAGFQRWEFYPIRREKAVPSIDCISLAFHRHRTDNYENFIIILNMLLSNGLYPGLCVFLNNHEHDTTVMINRAINALIALHNNGQAENKLPHIISSCHHSDRRFVSAQLMRYLQIHKQHYIHAYPLMYPYDSLLNRDLVSGNQMGTLVDALYNSDSEKRQKQFVKDKDGDDLVAELSYCLDDDAGAFMKLLSSLHNWELEIQTTNLVPSFSFCYTFNDRHFPDSFIFTGTAFLQKLNRSSRYIHGWSINSDHYLNQGSCADVIKNTNRYFDISSHSSKSMCNRRLTDCLISTYSMHSYCEEKENSDYWGFTKDDSQADKTDSQFDEGISEKVHYKLWSQANNIPGSLAKSMIDISLCSISMKNSEPSIVPYIEFTTSIPCGLNNKAMSNLYVRYFRTTGHTKYSEKYRSIMDNSIAPIQAIKIKLSNPVYSDYDQWVSYAKNLVVHLNDTYQLNVNYTC